MILAALGLLAQRDLLGAGLRGLGCRNRLRLLLGRRLGDLAEQAAKPATKAAAETAKATAAAGVVERLLRHGADDGCAHARLRVRVGRGRSGRGGRLGGARDHAVHLAAQARHYDDFPRTLPELLERGLVYGRYAATAKGRAAAGTLDSTDLHALVRQGLVDVEGLRYEDFLPVSAAGIFASNLNQYGTKSTAAVKPEYPRALLEQIMGRPIVDADVVYRGMEAASLLQTFADLGLLDRLPRQRREALEAAVAACPENSLKAH